jgi:hypothetical protein
MGMEGTTEVAVADVMGQETMATTGTTTVVATTTTTTTDQRVEVTTASPPMATRTKVAEDLVGVVVGVVVATVGVWHKKLEGDAMHVPIAAKHVESNLCRQRPWAQRLIFLL